VIAESTRPLLALFTDLAATTALARGEPMSNDFVRIRLTVGGKKVIAKLRDNVSTRGAPAGFDPSVGDVTYYAPWGNLAIFYKDFGYAKGLVSLGGIESGCEDLAALDGDTTVTIERLGAAGLN